MRVLPKPLMFEWNKGNINKNLKTHGVTDREIEEIFINKPLYISLDKKHSTEKETRYHALGKTDTNKVLFISLTVRDNKVRTISARPASEKRETNMQKNKLKPIPIFKDEDEERKFWATHDSTEYIDWDSAEEVIFPNLKPTTKTISLRLPEYLLYRIKELANAKDVPYQSLIKIFIADRVDKELQAKTVTK